jgi:serine/threonine-protein kinase
MQDCLKELEEQQKRQLGVRLSDVLLRRGLLQRRQVKAILDAYAQTHQIRALNKNIPGYQFLRVLGGGTAGTVFLAQQLTIGREVAIKVLKEDLARNPSFIRNFQREAKSAARLNHPNVIQAIDVGEAEGAHYFVMEYVEGETVQAILHREHRIDEARAVHIGVQMAEALQHACKYGIIHRDIKPANIILNVLGRAKLCDLGLARPIDSGTSTTIEGGRIAGTPAYMSPEQAMGKRDLDIRTDIYSLGSTLYHALTGAIPFTARNLAEMLHMLVRGEFQPPRKIRPELTEPTEKMILQMMARERSSRPKSPDELRDALTSLLASLPPAPPLPVTTPSGERIVPPTGYRPPAQFKIPTLTVAAGSDAGRRFILSLSHTTVGRHSSADVRLTDQWVSRHHFRILLNGDKARLEALSERNRTFLNGRPVERADLSPGDEISIFATVMRFDQETSAS